ncbi:DsbA family protein [Microbacterium sp. W1N]|uniref:DsbA family protein n=1 Tax=Microbacterium festucae TaxID=2977531 RepID=UPI0021C16B66|nr:DsbA family protein [Microbacterium festucae]MCT9821073.1 DsbA family protein [Microbacterium festucae]
MSNDDSTNEPERDRREVLREKAKLVHVKQSRARLARRSALVVTAVAAVAVVAVVVSWAIGSAADRPQLSPENTADDGFAVSSISGAVQGASDETLDMQAAPPADDEAQGEATAPAPTATAEPPVDIRVYVDYLSPAAREWQIANVQQLSSWVGQGAVALSYHPVSMLTAKSNGTKYSLRAASAAACVATYSPDTFFAYNNELLSKQPAVDSDGFTDKELATLAIASGVGDPKKVRSCIEEESFSTWVKSVTERAISGIPDADGVSLTGTPMVLVNGEQYVGSLSDPAEFSQFVLTSASDAFYKTQSPTPTPTP